MNMKTLKGFLMIERQMSLEVYMLESFIGHLCRAVSGSVDTTFASLYTGWAKK